MQRYGAGINKQLLSFIDNLKAITQKQIDSLSGKTINPSLTLARYTKLKDNITTLSTALRADMISNIKGDLSNLAIYEADFTKRLLDQASNLRKVGFETVVPTVKQLQASAFASILDGKIPNANANGDGLTVQKALDTYGRQATSEVLQTIRVGYAAGNTIAEMRKDIMSTLFPELDSKQNRNKASALARTITNHVSASARDEFYQSNDDIITGYQVVATLDDRTTLTCAALDGQVFDKDDFEKPPYHWNCRTTFIGVVDKKYTIQLADQGRVAKGDDGPETVSTKSNYNEFLSQQSSAFQDDVLGPERGALYRAGLDDVTHFVDENYHPINLDELKTKDNEHVFEKARKDIGYEIG